MPDIGSSNKIKIQDTWNDIHLSFDWENSKIEDQNLEKNLKDEQKFCIADGIVSVSDIWYFALNI